MSGVWMWVTLGAAIILLVWARSKWKSNGPSGAAASELKELCETFKQNGGASEDLKRWEEAISVMERFPNDYNVLDQEIQFIRTFTAYLERHYPDDARLESLRLIAAHRKNSIWGLTVNRD